MDWGQEAQDRLTDIASRSAAGPGVTRFPFTAEHAAALDVIGDWMARAGLAVHRDAAGTLIGRAGPDDSPALLIGSHQDSVRNGGRYDGIMGIAIGCLAVESLRAQGTPLPCAVEVLAFADEEGVRFPTALVGSRALAGTVDDGVFGMADRDGVTLGHALDAFGGDAAAVPSLARNPETVRGYLEVHIEQGPVLERADTPIGLVTAICGIERNAVTFTGETGHAGTVPMDTRRDALVAASEFVARVHDATADWPGIRATVGTLELMPDVVNAIPAHARLTLEIRAEDDARRAAFHAEAQRIGAEVAARRGAPFEMAQVYAQPAVPCDADLLAAAARAAPDAPHLPSGATHDASAMADLCPIAMLFVRCDRGISHRPEEHVSSADMGVAVAALARIIADQPSAR